MLYLALIVLALVAGYFYLTRNYGYWESRGVKHDKPMLLFGNHAGPYLLQRSVTQITADIYRRYPDEKIVGHYRGTHPELVIRDPEIIKRILLTDFNNFYARGLNPHKTVIEPLMKNLFFADGDLWRLLRQRMTPAFTSGKLRGMFPLIVEKAARLQAAAAASRRLCARDLMARYTTDFIGACGFGLDGDSLTDQNSAFRKLGRDIFKVGIVEAVIGVLKDMFPESFKNFRVMFKVEKDLTDLVKRILAQRNYEPSGRNDFIDLMLECRKKGVITGESIERVRPDGTPEQATLELTDALLAAQVFVFFAAGFETSSSATSFTLLQFAWNQDKQRKAQEEVDRILAKYGGELCYDAVKEMSYLEWCFKEAMRMFPSLGFLIRQTARKYTIPEIGLTIDPDVGILIPLQALHNDPKYFDNPGEFRPERFHPEAVKESNKYVYMPFGDGPRACIGARLGMMQSLAGLAAVLSKFTVEPDASTPRVPTVDPRSNIVQTLNGELPLIFQQRNDK